MMMRIVRQLVADDWPARLLFSSALGAAIWFLVSATSLHPQNLREWRLVIGFVSLSCAVVVTALLIALILSWIVLSPLYRHQARLNGAPFKVGDSVRVLSGPSKGCNARIYSMWQGDTFRVDLGESAKDHFADIFAAYQLEREPR
jgi:hypothetical protein